MKIWTKRTRQTFWKQTTANSTTLREILVLSQVPMRFEADYLERGNIKVLICHVVSFPAINLCKLHEHLIREVMRGSDAP